MSDEEALKAEPGRKVKIDQTWRKYPSGSKAPGMVFHDTPFGRFGRRDIPGDPELTPFTYEEVGNWVASLQTSQNAPESTKAPSGLNTGKSVPTKPAAKPVAQPKSPSSPESSPAPTPAPVDAGLQDEIEKALNEGDMDKVADLMAQQQAKSQNETTSPPVETKPSPSETKTASTETPAAQDETKPTSTKPSPSLAPPVKPAAKPDAKPSKTDSEQAKPSSPRSDLLDLMQSPKDWREGAKQAIQGATSTATQIELPELYSALKARFPSLTPAEFQRGMREMYENDELVLLDYTLAQADVADDPAAVLIPARTKKGGIYDQYKWYVQAYPAKPKVTARNPKPITPAPPKPKTAEDAIYEALPAPVQRVVDDLKKHVKDKLRDSFEVVAEPESDWSTLAMDLAERVSGKTGTARSMPVVWFRGNFANGMVYKGVVFLNADLSRPDNLWGVIAHEVSHLLGIDRSLKLDDPDLMDQLRDEYYWSSPSAMRGILKTNSDLWDREAIAYLIDRLFHNADFRRQMQQEKPTVWQKIVAAFRRLFERFTTQGKWDPKNPVKTLAQKHLDKIHEVFMGAVPTKVKSLTTSPEMAPSKYPELDDLMLSPMKDVAQYLRDRYKSTSNEEKFFARYMQDALRALQVQVSAKTRKGNVSKSGIRKAVDKYMEDVSEYLEANPNLAEYYANEAHRERAELVKVYPELAHDEVWAGYLMLNGMASAQTNLGENTQETIDMWGKLREKGEVPLTKKLNDKGQMAWAADGFVVYGGPSSRNKINNYRAFNKLLKKHGSVGEVAAFLTGNVSREGLLNLRRELGWATIGEIGPILDTVKHATGQTESIPRMFVFGPKVGSYILNRMGNHRYQTIDVWESRLARFYMSNIRFKPGSTGLLEGEDRKIAQEFGKLVAEELGLDAAAAQAVRWYHFKGFVKDLGYSKVKDEDLKTLSEITAGRLGVREGDGGESSGATASRAHAIIRGSGRGIEARRRASAQQIRDNLQSGGFGTTVNRELTVGTDIEVGTEDDTLYLSPRTKEDPKKTVKAYKLFVTKADRPGELFPLFVGANDAVKPGQWYDAEAGEMNDKGKVKSKLGGLAFRPGWHAGDLPIATHIGGKTEANLKAPNYRPAHQVWAEVELADDVDWQTEANKRAERSKSGKVIPRTAHITDQVPTDGYYRYKTNSNMVGEWMISGSMKVVRVLSDAEVKEINDKAGVADLPRLSSDNTLYLSPYDHDTAEAQQEKQKQFNKAVAKLLIAEKGHATYRQFITDLMKDKRRDIVLKYEKYLRNAWDTARAMLPKLNLTASQDIGSMFPATIVMVGEPASNSSQINSQASTGNNVFVAMDDDNEQVVNLTTASVQAMREVLERGGNVFLDLGSWRSAAAAEGKGWARVTKAVGMVIQGLQRGQASRVRVILPDVMGNQTESHIVQMRVANELAPLRDSGVTFVVPIQHGQMSLEEYTGLTVTNMPSSNLAFGIPIGGRQWSRENAVEYAAKEADNAAMPTRIHLMGVDNRLASSIASDLQAVNAKAEVTAENSARHRGDDDHLDGIGERGELSRELRKLKLKLKKEGDSWIVTENKDGNFNDKQGTYNNQDWLKNIGGVWSPSYHGYRFEKDPRQDIYNHVTRRRRELEEKKRVEESRRDLSVLSKPATEIVSKETQDAINAGRKIGVAEKTLEGQIEDIARVSEAIEGNRRAFILAAGTGTGKTFVLGGVVKEALNKGFTRIVWVTKNQELIAQAKDNIGVFGVDPEKVEFITYSVLSKKRASDTEGALLIFDESQEINNFVPDTRGVDHRKDKSKRAVEAQGMIRAARFTVFSSATPILNPVQAGYIAASGVFDLAGGFVEWAQIYGAALAKTTKNTETVIWQKGGRETSSKVAEARSWLLRRGVFSRQPVHLPKDMVITSFRRAKLAQEQLAFYAKVMAAYEAATRDRPDLTMRINRYAANSYKRLTEYLKVPAAIERVKQLVDSKKQVVVFTPYKSATWLGRYEQSKKYREEHNIPDSKSRHFTADEVISQMEAWKEKAALAKARKEAVEEPPFAEELWAIAKAMRDLKIDKRLESTFDLFADAFSADEVGYYAGAFKGDKMEVKSGKAKSNDLQLWMKNKKKVLVSTISAGGTGLSLHDTTGKMPIRVQVGIALPWTGYETEQTAGRLARGGIKKKVGIEWLFAEGITFEKLLASKVGRRLTDMGAMVNGIESAQGSALEDFDFEDNFDPTSGGVARELPTEIEDDAREDLYGDVQEDEEVSPEKEGSEVAQEGESEEGDDGVDEGVTELGGFKIDDLVEYADPGDMDSTWIGSIVGFKGDSAWVATEDEEYLIPLSWMEHIEDTPSIDDIPVDKPTPPPAPPKEKKQAETLFDVERPDTSRIFSIDPQKVQVAPGMQFKKGADKEGVTERDKIGEEQEWDETLAGTFLFWQDNDGKVFVADGHHRLAHAKKVGAPLIHGYLRREQDGYSFQAARAHAALINIKNDKGTVYDHAAFFRDSEITETKAQADVLFRKVMARTGFLVGRFASDPVYEAFLNEDITPEKAAVIAEVGKDNLPIQAVGLKWAKTKRQTAEVLRESLRIFRDSRAASEGVLKKAGKLKQLSIFEDYVPTDDELEAEREADAIAAVVVKEKSELRETIRRHKLLLNNPESARKQDVSFNEQTSRSLIEVSNAALDQWEHVGTDPGLYEKARQLAGLPPRATDGLGQEVASSYGGSGGSRYKGSGAAPANQPSTSFPFTPSQVLHPMPLGMLYDLATAMIGSPPEMKKLRSALGMAIHKEMLGVEHMRILLDKSAAADTDLLRKVLAHEIGHIDDVIDPNSPLLNTIKRGNVVGRIQKLRGFRQNVFMGTKNSDLRQELINLTEWWSGNIAGSASYVRYRKSSKELFAEFLSVFLVSPGEAKSRAPETYAAFISALDKHEPMKRELIAIQAELSGSSTAEADRMARVLPSMWGRGEDAFLAHRRMLAEKIYRPSASFVISMQALLLDSNAHALAMSKEMVKKKQLTAYEEGEYRAIIDDMHHANSPGLAALHRFYEFVTKELEAANIPRTIFDNYMYAVRVQRDTSREGKANPMAVDDAAAYQYLQKLPQDIGAVKWAKLVAIGRNASDIMFDTFERGYKAGLFTDEMMDQARLNRYSYMPFVIMKYYNGFVHPGIKPVEGTFDDTAPATEAITKKIIAMERAIIMNRAITETLKLARNSFSYHARKLATDNLGNILPSEKINNDINAVLWVMEGGKEVPYEVDKFLADVFKTHNIQDLKAAVRMANNVIYSVWHPLFVTFSPAFMVRNVFRDSMRTLKQVPAFVTKVRKDKIAYLIAGGMTKQQAEAATKDMKLGSLEMLWRYYAPAMLKTWAAVRGKDTAFIRKYLEKGVIGEQLFTVPKDQVNLTGKSLEYDRMLQEGGIVDVPDDAKVGFKKALGAMVRPLKITGIPSMFNLVKTANRVWELGSKIATADATEAKGLGEQQVKYGARKFAGTPDFHQRGSMTGPANSISMYFKVKMVGLASDAYLATTPSSAFGWWMRTMLIAGMPVFANAVLRMMFPAWKEAEDRIPEYLRKNYLCLFWPGVTLDDPNDPESYKQAMITIPMDETTRFVHNVMTNLFDVLMRDHDDWRKSSFFKMMKNDINATAEQIIPSYNPAITIAGGWIDYLSDTQPIDPFYKEPIIPDRQWDVRDEMPWPTVQKMAAWTIRQFGVVDTAYQSIGSPFTGAYYSDEQAPWYKSVWKMSGAGSLFRATNRGMDEKLYREQQLQGLEGVKFRARLNASTRRLSTEFETLRDTPPAELSDSKKARREELRAWMNGTYNPIRQAIQNAQEIGLTDQEVKDLYSRLNDTAGSLEVLDADTGRKLKEQVRLAKVDDDLGEPVTTRDVGGRVASLLDQKMYLTRREAEEAAKMGVAPEEAFRRIQAQMYSDRKVTKAWLRARGITPQQALEAYQVYAHERAANTRRKPGRVDPESLRRSVLRLAGELQQP
jgi:hypothetical protein